MASMFASQADQASLVKTGSKGPLEPPPCAVSTKSQEEIRLEAKRPSPSVANKRFVGVIAALFVSMACSLGAGIGLGLAMCDKCGATSGATMQCEVSSPVTQSVEQIDLSAAMMAVSSLAANGSDPALVRSTQARICESLNDVAVSMATGNVHRFRVEGCMHFTDGKTIITGIGGEQLVYPANGGAPYLLKANTQRSGGGSAPSAGSRRRRMEELEAAMMLHGGHGRELQSWWDSWWSSSDPPSSPPPSTPTDSSTSSVCTDQTASACRTCVNAADPWCEVNTWEETCKAVCDGPTQYTPPGHAGCAIECSDPIGGVDANLNGQGNTETPVDCAVSGWSAFDSCQFFSGSATCKQMRTRTITTSPKFGGTPCPELQDEQECPCPSECGDGKFVSSTEECDDGNDDDGDGCSSTCTIEPGWSCSTQPNAASMCVAAQCGDGIQAGLEGCDDGNVASYDGCSATCETETYFSCEGGIGSLTTCQCWRVRKDWLDLRPDEKDLYLEAVNMLKASGVYDQFVTTHAHQANKDYAHGTSGFLPWHRKYLLEYENALREQDARFSCLTVPYWDWAEQTLKCEADPQSCTHFHSKGGITHDFGGPGDADCMTSSAGTVATNAASSAKGCNGKTTHGSSAASHDGTSGAIGCVTSGPFAGWMSPDFPEDQSTTTKCLTRGVSWEISQQGHLSGPIALQEIMHRGSYGRSSGFRARLEGNPHATPHNYLGGHIRSFSSPADPLFFSHHAFVDKVWDMWQNCHDHDEVAKADITSAVYRSTGQSDGVDDPMPFSYPAGTSNGASSCAKTDSTCAACVHSRDSWCSSNAWDSVCENLCTAGCASQCGGESAREGVEASSVISTWDGATQRPRDFHSIHDLGTNARTGKPNSYLYAPDELDERMGNGDICNLAPSAHHAQQWQSSRRKLAAAELASRRDLHLKMTVRSVRSRRQLQASSSSLNATGFCALYGAVPVADAGGAECPWAGDGACDDGGPGAAYASCDYGTDFPDCGDPPRGFSCECAPGYMWNLGSPPECISMHWQYRASDPDTVAGTDYFNEFLSRLKADSKYIKARDKEHDAYSSMQTRECELLYNSVNGVTFVDETRVVDSPRNRFLRAWGLSESIDEGAVDDPCADLGNNTDASA